MAQHRLEVRDAGNGDDALVHVRRQRSAGERGIAAIAPSQDAGAIAVGPTHGDERLCAVRDVVLHLAAPLAIAGLGEGRAKAARAAEVRLQHDITFVGGKLSEPVEADAVVGFRTAVRHDDHRQVLALVGRDARRPGDQGWNGKAVARLVFDRRDLADLVCLDVGARARNLRDRLCGAVVQHVARRLLAALGIEQDFRPVVSPRDEGDGGVWQRRNPGLHFLVEHGVEQFVSWVESRVGDTHHDAVLVEDRSRHCSI